MTFEEEMSKNFDSWQTVLKENEIEDLRKIHQNKVTAKQNVTNIRNMHLYHNASEVDYAVDYNKALLQSTMANVAWNHAIEETKRNLNAKAVREALKNGPYFAVLPIGANTVDRIPMTEIDRLALFATTLNPEPYLNWDVAEEYAASIKKYFYNHDEEYSRKAYALVGALSDYFDENKSDDLYHPYERITASNDGIRFLSICITLDLLEKEMRYRGIDEKIGLEYAQFTDYFQQLMKFEPVPYKAFDAYDEENDYHRLILGTFREQMEEGTEISQMMEEYKPVEEEEKGTSYH